MIPSNMEVILYILGLIIAYVFFSFMVEISELVIKHHPRLKRFIIKNLRDDSKKHL